MSPCCSGFCARPLPTYIHASIFIPRLLPSALASPNLSPASDLLPSFSFLFSVAGCCLCLDSFRSLQVSMLKTAYLSLPARLQVFIPSFPFYIRISHQVLPVLLSDIFTSLPSASCSHLLFSLDCYSRLLPGLPDSRSTLCNPQSRHNLPRGPGIFLSCANLSVQHCLIVGAQWKCEWMKKFTWHTPMAKYLLCFQKNSFSDFIISRINNIFHQHDRTPSLSLASALTLNYLQSLTCETLCLISLACSLELSLSAKFFFPQPC